MPKLTAFFLIVLMAANLSGSPAIAGGPEGSAADFVAGLGLKVVQVVSEDAESGASRHDRLGVLIEDALSIGSMAKNAVGSYWGRFAPEQQDRFVEVFRRYLLNYCVGLLDERAPDSLAVISAQPINAFDTRVTTRVKSGIWTLADIDWLVREIDGAYRIVDIAMNGVSLVTTYRSEFRSVISRNGLDGLILALAVKAPNLSADAAATAPPRTAPRIRSSSSP